MKKFDIKSFIEEVNKNEFVKKCSMPLGYKATYPIISEKRGKVLLTVPFNKVMKTKTSGVSAILPIAYTVTFELNVVKSIPESLKERFKGEEGFTGATAVAFESLKYADGFEKADFSKPIDSFPHKAIEEIGKEEYKAKAATMNSAYNAVINDLLGIEKASGMAKLEFKQTLDLLLPPVTKQLYAKIDKEFYDNYLK